MQARCEPRTFQESAVRVYGIDGEGKPISQAAWTVDISRRGARLRSIPCWEAPGETIGVRHGEEKARFRIVWVGRRGTPQEGQVGLVCVEDGKFIWATTAPQSERAAPAATSTGTFSFAGLSPRSGGVNNRRKDARYRAEGGVKVQEQGAPAAQWTTLHDVSAGGCYVETTTPLLRGSRVHLVVYTGEFQIDAWGEVTLYEAMVGMGIRFTEVSALNRSRLTQLLELLQRTAPEA